MPCDILRACDFTHAIFSLGLCRHEFVVACQQNDVSGPEDDGGDTISDHIDPVERTVIRHGVYAGHEEVRRETQPSDLELLGACHVGIESIDEGIAGLRSQFIDNSGCTESYGVSV